MRTRRICARAMRHLWRMCTPSKIRALARRTGIRERVCQQTQLEAEGPGELGAEQHRGHRHLAIGDFPERPAILPLHHDRVSALLWETGVVDGQNAAPHLDHGAQLGPHQSRLPRRVRDELLQGLIADRVAEPSMHRLHGRPLAVVEEPFEVLTGRRALRVATEAARKAIGECAELPQERSSRPLCHALKRIELSTFVQVRNLESSCTKHWI